MGPVEYKKIHIFKREHCKNERNMNPKQIDMDYNDHKSYFLLFIYLQTLIFRNLTIGPNNTWFEIYTLVCNDIGI